ncbi:MAG: hypothetical protein ACSNEK_06470 [Parachlamydiaceae bacterium]
MSLSFSQHLRNSFTYCPRTHFKAQGIKDGELRGQPCVYLGLLVAYIPLVGAVTTLAIGIFNRFNQQTPKDGKKILAAFVIRATLSLITPLILPMIDLICSIRHRILHKKSCV